MKNRLVKLILKIFKIEKKKNVEIDYFHLCHIFLKYLGLYYAQSNLTRKIGLSIFMVTQASIIVPQVIIFIIQKIQVYNQLTTKSLDKQDFLKTLSNRNQKPSAMHYVDNSN